MSCLLTDLFTHRQGIASMTLLRQAVLAMILVCVPVLAAAGLDDPPSPFVMAFCDGGYTTNLPAEDLLEGKALVVWEYDGEPLEPEHGGPARLLVPHLYFWKSASGYGAFASWTTTSQGSGR